MKLRRCGLAAVMVLASASAAHAGDALAGEWAGKNGSLTFQEDGTYSLGDSKGKWRREGSTLTLADADGSSGAYQYKIEGDKLTLSGGDLEEPLTFERKVKKGPLGKAVERAKETQPVDAKPAEAAKPELSRPPQAALEGVTKFTPKFKSPTKEIKDPEGKWTVKVPEKWTFPQSGQDANARYVTVNPGYGPMDIVKHQIAYWQVPVLPGDASKGFKDRCEEGAQKLAALYPTFKREKLEVLDAPSGLIGIVRFSGAITNAYGQQQPVVSFVAVRQVKHYYLAATVISLKEAANEVTDDVLAALDATVMVIKDRDPEAERRLVGEWVSTLKTKGTALETYKFNADGTYEWHFESSFVVNVKDQDGNTKASAGGAAADDERGRYEIRGETIYFVSNKGEQGQFFRIRPEGGRTYLDVGAAHFMR